MKVFNLSWRDWDSHDDYYFHGPDMEDGEFQSIVASLQDEAAENALKNSCGWVGWEAITAEIACLLEKRGFTRFNPVSAVLFGPNIIDSAIDAIQNKDLLMDDELINKIEISESMQKVIDYNVGMGRDRGTPCSCN